LEQWSNVGSQLRDNANGRFLFFLFCFSGSTSV